MTVKKSYEIGDIVWVYGISRSNNKITKGTIVHSFTLDHIKGYNSEVYYLVSIPNSIESLLEVRTWHTISQDSRGPVGSFREVISKVESDATDKKLSQIGLNLEDEMDLDDDEPTAEQIHAAIEKSQQTAKFPPLDTKENKPRRRYPPRKKKTNAS